MDDIMHLNSPFWKTVTPEWVLPYAGYAMLFNNLSANATYVGDPNTYALNTGGQSVSMAILGVQGGRLIYDSTAYGVRLDAVANIGVVPNMNWDPLTEYTLADGTPIRAQNTSSTSPQVLISLGLQGNYSGFTVAVLGGTTYESITSTYAFTNSATGAPLYTTENNIVKWKPIVEADFGYEYKQFYAGMTYYGSAAVPGINTVNNGNFVTPCATQVTQGNQYIWDIRLGYVF
jgi:hypothetical protein